MARQSDAVRQLLARGPLTSRQLVENTGSSQPTVSRALARLGDEVVRIGAGPAIRYALRDTTRGFASAPIFSVNEQGLTRELGVLLPVRPEGFVMAQADGDTPACRRSRIPHRPVGVMPGRGLTRVIRAGITQM
ncbi:MAG: ArsR family transcriptional regulator, partial [Chitinimonas sp.]|nr:ArsR family transcriptional regulator [Chitinimonas sp.]